MRFKSIYQSGQHQLLNVIQKWAFHFFDWRGVVDGVWVHQPVWPTSEVECNTKMSISFFWLERGGRWGLSPSTSLADHQKWTQSKKKHFILLAGEGWQMGFESIDQPGWSSEVERNQKMSISFFWQERSGRWGSSSSISPVDHQKWTQSKNKHFIFWLESSGGWGSSPLTSTAYHQKLNIIKIWAFHFLGWRWGVDWV